MPVSRQASKIRWSLVRACARVCNSFGRRVRRELEGRLSSKFVHAPLGAGRGDPNRGARGHFASEIEAARSDDTRVTKGRCWRDPRTAFSPSFYSFSPPPPCPALPLFDNRKRHHQTIFSIERVGQNSFATLVRFFFHRSRKFHRPWKKNGKLFLRSMMSSRWKLIHVYGRNYFYSFIGD